MTRIVVVGAGMAAARLVDRLAQHPSAPHVTVLGAERQPPYNRVLLSAALTDPRRLAELALRSPRWYREAGVELVVAARAVGVDRAAHQVHLLDGRVFAYDRMVIATGANPILPPVRGIVTAAGRLHPSVTTFRSYDDCRRLVAMTRHGRRAVVIGGGLVGLEAARGLAASGVQVDLVHLGPHLLHEHIDADGSQLLRRHVERLGVGVHTGLGVSSLVTNGARLVGVRLADGYLLDADLAVIAAGSRPATGLAAGCGLAVRGGVLVEETMRSVSDPDVFAIGDCAEPVAGTRSAPTAWTAWDQAEVAAETVTGGRARYDAPVPVVRLRAAGLDVAAIGDLVEPTTGSATVGGGCEVVRVRNPLRGSYKRLDFRAGRLVGGIMVGDTTGAAALTAALDRPWLPVTPAAMLLGTATAAAAGVPGPGSVPDAAIVCACNGVTAGRLRGALARAGSKDSDTALAAVVAQTRATTGCGGCRVAVASMIAKTTTPTAAGQS